VADEQICENCHQSNSATDFYCYACGHILPIGMQIHSTHALPNETLKPQIRWGTAYFGEHMMLRIHVRDANELIETSFDDECVLGRKFEDADPNIDLTPYQATSLGVSRLHAKLTRQIETVMVEDLGSVNGTFLNGQKLVPYQPRVLRNEDELRLGHLKLRISFTRASRRA